MKPRLTAIVAMTQDRVIGRAGKLPWNLPEDLAFFKRTTSGHPIVMGRKTYESIGRPLPNRRNIVLTRNLNWSAPGLEVIHQPDQLQQLPEIKDQVFIIGGSEIYTAFLPQLDDLLVSHVFENLPGDTYFPNFEADFPISTILEIHLQFKVCRYSRASLPAEFQLATEIPPF